MEQNKVKNTSTEEGSWLKGALGNVEEIPVTENERNLIESISFREPKKVPIGIEVTNWPFAYAGVTYKEVMDDPERGANAYMKFLDDIHIDYMWGPPGISRGVKATQAMGSKNYYLGPDDTTICHAQGESTVYMNVEDYDEFIADPNYFMEETLLKRKLPVFQKSKQEAYNTLVKALKLYKPVKDTNDLIMKKFTEKGIARLLFRGPMYSVPLDTLFDTARGIKNTLADLRRYPDKVKAACDKIFEMNMADMAIKPSDFSGKYGLFCGGTVYHSACFLNPKQFDEMFMSYLIKGFKPFFEAGAHMFLKGEGKFIHTLHKYRQLPKGSMVIMLEEDDPFECYKEIGDWATLATGITSNLLKYGTKQECIDYAKKCFDTFAPGGGFIFMQDRPLMGPNDAKIENVRAVYEFVNEYGKK